MGRIIFYEDRNFQGRSYETSSDCAELTSYLSRCSSCKVESGCFMVYERPNYMGHQVLVKRDNKRLMGMSMCNCICMVPIHRGQTENIGGQVYEPAEDCDFVTLSAQFVYVMNGNWLMYELPRYKGWTVYLRPGDMGWGSLDRTFESIRRTVESLSP